MTELFDRRATLRVDTIEIRDLRFTFSVERTLRTTPNRAQIHVFNLNPQHRNQLAGLGEVHTELTVGYRDHQHTIFSGDLRSARSKYASPDWDTTIEGADGGRAHRTARVNRSYRRGTSLETAVRDLADALGLGHGNLVDAMRSARLIGAGLDFVGGTTIRGAASTELEQLARTMGLEVSVQNGTLQFLPIGAALDGGSLIVEQDSGLIGDVEVDTKTGGLKFKTLLIPDLAPGRKVEPRTRTLRGGHYRITKCTYKGDTHGPDWYVECEASPPTRRS